MTWLINIDASILLWIQENLRADFWTPFWKAVTALGNGGWFRGDEPDCRADDWRHDHRTFAVAVYYPGGV